MYLTAERIAVANKAVQDTFEQTSVAWQAIPHWDTGDPGQIRVRCDLTYAADVKKVDDISPPLGGASVELKPKFARFDVNVAQAIAPTPDALLAAVIARTVHLARRVDDEVIQQLLDAAAKPPIPATKSVAHLVDAFIEARAKLERAGYRAPSCLLTDTKGLQALNQLEEGISVLQPVLDAANINSLYRIEDLGATHKGEVLLLGRRQRIAHGGAAAASCGEEPIDLAVSVPPSLEVVGENSGNVEMAVRIRFAPRLTDKSGVVGVRIS
jgi:hypothetical protein